MMSQSKSTVCVVVSSSRAIYSHITSTFSPYSDYVPLVDLISIYFQIRDDYMNLQSTQVRSAPHYPTMILISIIVHSKQRLL